MQVIIDFSASVKLIIFLMEIIP